MYTSTKSSPEILWDHLSGDSLMTWNPILEKISTLPYVPIYSETPPLRSLM